LSRKTSRFFIKNIEQAYSSAKAKKNGIKLSVVYYTLAANGGGGGGVLLDAFLKELGEKKIFKFFLFI
jgi:hypothetical protein